MELCFDGHPEHLPQLPSVTLGSGRIVKSEHDTAGASSFVRSKPVKFIFYPWGTYTMIVLILNTICKKTFGTRRFQIRQQNLDG